MRKEDADKHERFLTLFAANEPAIRAFVRRLLPSRQDAADVMQGIALVLWRKFNASENSEDFRNIFRRGINDADVVTISPDRRVLRVAFERQERSGPNPRARCC